MSSSLPSYTDSAPDGGLVRRLDDLVASAHAVWASPDERRRMRAFGFRPAVEANVLKREWHGLEVRVSPAELRVRGADGRTLIHADGATGLTVGGAPLTAADAELEPMAGMIDLIGSYERWVEVREGRRERMSRAPRSEVGDRRPVNALAETRRLQRILHLPPRRRG